MAAAREDNILSPEKIEYQKLIRDVAMQMIRDVDKLSVNSEVTISAKPKFFSVTIPGNVMIFDIGIDSEEGVEGSKQEVGIKEIIDHFTLPHGTEVTINGTSTSFSISLRGNVIEQDLAHILNSARPPIYPSVDSEGNTPPISRQVSARDNDGDDERSDSGGSVGSGPYELPGTYSRSDSGGSTASTEYMLPDDGSDGEISTDSDGEISDDGASHPDDSVNITTMGSDGEPVTYL